MAKKLEITLTRSVIGRSEGQKLTVKTLGLNKIRQSVVREDTPAVRGMINKVSHLVSVKEV
ncbi:MULTISPECIES: 50S ribosomal protein L30 [Sediminibacillus]|uniref:Large ribosomal subunit protein uL30 n=2 Tax=Sediminibacillus TaxID=482460 RepID=A0A1G9YZY5_9BACI|nr:MULTISPECIES: 50S ribosomal protein L30 [Sediminibacillus]QTM97898.1 50S ribosomal protein L30 [Sediminibacillus dalangtanensis]SDN14043.1 large subunit ribosomal protein L30 [Sediminibacillus halophilus]